MFENILSFDGRIGRLRYLGQTMLVGLCGGVAIALILTLFAFTGPQTLSFVVFGLFMAGLAATMLWTGLALQAKRFRDIGWDPLYVITAWMVIGVLDRLVAHINPALSLGAHHGTIVGLLVNLTLSMALLFMPGREDEDIGAGRGPTRTTRFDSFDVEAAEAPRSMPMPRGAPRAQFGRRNA